MPISTGIWQNLMKYGYRVSPIAVFVLYLQGRENNMADYQKMYSKLFNAVTDAVNILQQAQSGTEEIYMENEPANITQQAVHVDSDDNNGDNNA